MSASRHRTLKLSLSLVVPVLLFSACGEDFKPETLVEDLRVLGLRAEPPELPPGATAELSALTIDPSAPTRRNTLVWLSCDPDPLDLGRSACSDLAQLGDTASLFQSGAGELPPGMRFAGFGPTARYTAPAEIFDALPADDARRQTGTVAQLLMMTIGEEVSIGASAEELNALMERVRTREVPSVLSIFRLRVSEATKLNQNPQLGDLVFNGQAVPAGAHVLVHPGDEALMRLNAPAEAFEVYEQTVPEGMETRTERLILSPYSTTGRFSLDRLAVGEDVDTIYRAPGGEEKNDPVPSDGRGRLWLVVRDTRGGTSWRDHRIHICEGLAEVPAVSQITLDESVPGELRVTLEGARLERIVDVLIGAQALQDAAYSPALDRFSGTLPALPAGAHPVFVRTRDCVELDTGHVLRR